MTHEQVKFCNQTGLTEEQINGEIIRSDLKFNVIDTIPSDVKLNVNGNLDLGNLISISNGVEINVMDRLHANNLVIIPKISQLM